MFIQKMKYAFLTASLVLAGLFVQAQFKDSLIGVYSGEAHLFGAFHNRVSIVNGQNAKLQGVQGGLVFGEKHKLLLAYSWMGVPATQQKIRNAHTPLADTVIKSQSMNFFSFGQDYVWHQTAKWKFSVPTHIGIGTSTFKEYSLQNNLIETETKLIVPIEIGASASYYFTDWLAANGGLGQRFTLSRAKQSQLNGPYYKLGVGVLLGVVYKKLKKSMRN
jgi:hypothetical protein